MSNKEKLFEIQKLKERISKQKELIEYYETMTHSLGGSCFEERVNCSPNLDAPFVKWIYKRIEAEDKLKQMEKYLEGKVEELSSIVEMMENIDYRRILIYRYILDKDWDTIADLLHLSISTVYRYHRLSLKAIEEI